MSIPFFFQPVRTQDEVIVDGGVVSNFPAWAFDSEQQDEPLPILGFRLQPDDVPPVQIETLFGLAKAMIFTMTKAGIPLQIAKVQGLNVIELPTLGVQTTDFDITGQQKNYLYVAGKNRAEAWLATNTLAAP